LSNYFSRKGGLITSLRGTWYFASLPVETNVIRRFLLRIKSSQFEQEFQNDSVCISTQSSTSVPQISDDSIDYIFTDPPFGSNLMYSELNFILESWYKIFTNNTDEAIVNNDQEKKVRQYHKLMELCLSENYRILKPGRWMSVVFHNSQNKIWIAIQDALMRVGFVIADVRLLDKKRGSFKQVNSLNAVKQDLVISAYKPSTDFIRLRELHKGDEAFVWDFVRNHLEHLPIYVETNGIVEIINERQSHILIDRVFIYHVQHQISIPISASEFYAGLRKRFSERDGMYFLANQVHEYDKQRMLTQNIEQTTIFVQDEKSAVIWLKQKLLDKPQTYQEMYTDFTQNLYKQKHEEMPELRTILEQNFVQNENGKWNIPDPSIDRDLEQIRKRSLLNEFNDYVIKKGKLRSFRSEAIRAGFSESWAQGEYEIIISVAEKLPALFLQEDPNLFMYYDNAMTRMA